ncbi:MAG: tripartite tricarboxylate transporter substrate-binding protein [Polaromonas sp.]|nr:tripartite tricarboxylate transporter substrate-binding protein [Polaromonas sp.]
MNRHRDPLNSSPSVSSRLSPADRARRRSLLLGAASLVAGAPAWSQERFPARPLRLIVPYSAGGATDTVARLLAQRAGGLLGQTVVVDNRPGAGGAIGADAAAKAAPDGYTLLQGTIGPIALAPAFNPKLPYDPVKDLAPVAWIGSLPNLLLVRADSPWRTVADVIAAARAKPGLAYGSGGNGTTQHLSGALFEAQAGISLTHVPYRGGAPALQDLLAGTIPLLFDASSGVAGALKSGQVRGIAVTASQRVKGFEDIPTFAEAGWPGMEVLSWQGVFVPAATPAPVMAELARQLTAALRQPETVAGLEAAGLTPAPKTNAEFRDFVVAETRKWGEVIRTRNIRSD